MTENERKEVEELAKDLKEIRECEIKEHCLLLDGDVAKKLYAKGYTKRPQDRCKTVVRFLDDWYLKSVLCFDMGQHECQDLATEICERFSQQPPKERKVSLEEIKDALFYVATNAKQKAGSIKTHVNIEGDLLEISARILNLLNTTEERKGE